MDVEYFAQKTAYTPRGRHRDGLASGGCQPSGTLRFDHTSRNLRESHRTGRLSMPLVRMQVTVSYVIQLKRTIAVMRELSQRCKT